MLSKLSHVLDAQIEVRITLEVANKAGELSTAQVNQMKDGEINKALEEIIIAMEEIAMDGETDNPKSSNLCK